MEKNLHNTDARRPGLTEDRSERGARPIPPVAPYGTAEGLEAASPLEWRFAVPPAGQACDLGPARATFSNAALLTLWRRGCHIAGRTVILRALRA